MGLNIAPSVLGVQFYLMQCTGLLRSYEFRYKPRYHHEGHEDHEEKRMNFSFFVFFVLFVVKNAVLGNA